MSTCYSPRGHPGSVVFQVASRVPFSPPCCSPFFDGQNALQSRTLIRPSLVSTMACYPRCGCLPPPDPVPGRFDPPWSQQLHAGMAAPVQRNQNPATSSSVSLPLLSAHPDVAFRRDLLAKSEASQANRLLAGDDPGCPIRAFHQDHLVVEHPCQSTQPAPQSWSYDSPPPEYSDETSSGCLTACVLEALGKYSHDVVPTTDINLLTDHVAEFIYQMCGHFAEHGSVPSWSVSDMAMPSEGTSSTEVYRGGRGYMGNGTTDSGTPTLVDGQDDDATLVSPTDLQDVLFSPMRESRFS